MSRSDWGILTALAGLAALFVAFGTGLYVASLNYPHEQLHQPYLYFAEKTGQVAADKANSKLLQYRTPCHQPEGQGESELCAQWKAADAAADSAWWAAVGSFAGAISTALVIVALYFAFKSNWIARDTAKRQLRAYISIEPGGINEAQNGLSRVPFNIINNGQTPAYELEHGGDFVVIEGNPMEFDPSLDGRLDGQTAVTDQSLGPNSNRFSYAYLEAALCAPFLAQIDKKEAAIIHYGYVTYKDAFGERHRTSFAFYHWGEVLSDLESKRCRFGNDAT